MDIIKSIIITLGKDKKKITKILDILTYFFLNFRTFTFGVGDPIRNGLSPMIILAITAMLGALIVVVITASIVCIVKKWRKRSENYRQL